MVLLVFCIILRDVFPKIIFGRAVSNFEQIIFYNRWFCSYSFIFVSMPKIRNGSVCYNCELQELETP